MNKIKLSENDVEQALNFIGVDKDSAVFKKIMGKSIKRKATILELQKACMDAEFNNDIPVSSIILAAYYQLLLKCCHGNKENAKDMEKILSIIENASCINVMPSDSEDYETNFMRTNRVLAALMKGFLYFETPDDLSILSSSDFNPEEFFDRYAIPYYKYDPDRFEFYALLTLSKLEDTEQDYKIFDDNNEISSRRLLNVVSDGIDMHNIKKGAYSNTASTTPEDITEKENVREMLPSDISQKRLIFRRPSYHASKELTTRQ